MEKNQEEIAISNVEKFITVKEMEAVITVLKARQEYFEQIARDREAFEDKAIAKLQEAENIPEDLVNKIKLLSSEFAKAMDDRFINDHKEELKAQEGVNEFLLRFTGEKQVNYNSLFLNK